MIRSITFILILGILIIYRSLKLKTLNREKQKKDSKIFYLSSYNKLNKLLVIFFTLEIIIECITMNLESFSSIVWGELIVIFCFVMIIYTTKESLKATVILRQEDMYVFLKEEENIRFKDIKTVTINNTANKYVYLITLFLKDGREYRLKGRDKYEMNRLVKIISDNIKTYV